MLSDIRPNDDFAIHAKSRILAAISSLPGHSQHVAPFRRLDLFPVEAPFLEPLFEHALGGQKVAMLCQIGSHIFQWSILLDV